jgi:uncharacterized repeat protein (TIGR01451 family)
VLDNLVNLTDADGNVFDYSFVGHLRGVKQNVRPLTMSMVSVRRSFPGSQVRYTINVSNTGVGPAQNVVVTDTLPAGLIFVDSVPPPNAGSAGTLTWRLGTIPRPGKVTIRLTTRIADTVAPNTVLTNSAEVVDAAGNGAFASTRVTVVEK